MKFREAGQKCPASRFMHMTRLAFPRISYRCITALVPFPLRSAPLIPLPKSHAILLCITPRGRPAGEQWRGEPGAGFASRAGSSSGRTWRASMARDQPELSQKPAPRGGCRLVFIYSEAASASGSVQSRQPRCRRRFRTFLHWLCRLPFSPAKPFPYICRDGAAPPVGRFIKRRFRRVFGALKGRAAGETRRVE